LASIQHVRQAEYLRERLYNRASSVKAALADFGLPVMPSPSHIVPVLIGEASLCRTASEFLLSDYGIYIQPITIPPCLEVQKD
jgi:5-aminolevulinate synthase